jgi:hypothetical protein
MHLLSLAGEMVLTPGAALKFVTPEVSQNYFFQFQHHMTYTLLVRRKIKQT